MGFRLFRIGNKVNVGEVSRFSFRRSTRGSSILFYIIALLAVVVIAKCLGYEIPEWVTIIISVAITGCIGLIDRQLPHRRYKSLAWALLLMGVTFTAFGVWRFIVRQMPLETDAWILGILMTLSFGYGTFCLWRWRRCILEYKDIVLQRELRARRRRKITY